MRRETLGQGDRICYIAFGKNVQQTKKNVQFAKQGFVQKKRTDEN